MIKFGLLLFLMNQGEAKWRFNDFLKLDKYLRQERRFQRSECLVLVRGRVNVLTWMKPSINLVRCFLILTQEQLVFNY